MQGLVHFDDPKKPIFRVMNKVAPKNKFRSESQWVKRGKLWKTGDSAFVTLFLGWRKRDPKSKDVGDLQLGENKVTA